MRRRAAESTSGRRRTSHEPVHSDVAPRLLRLAVVGAAGSGDDAEGLPAD